MELGVIGLGRMGQIVVERTLAAGHTVVAYDPDPVTMKTVCPNRRVPLEPARPVRNETLIESFPIYQIAFTRSFRGGQDNA
jgi:6-phosphogluconate dehydrogenase